MFGKEEKKEIKRLLVMRFSAMGDVAMTVPVLNALAKQNPQLRITMLTRDRFAGMYEWLPSNVVVRGVNFDAYKGILGLARLYSSLMEYDFDAVADLHDVIRTKFLRTCFSVNGTRVAIIDKGREEKRALIGCGQTHEPLKRMTDRYVEVFKRLGLKLELNSNAVIDLNCENFYEVNKLAGGKSQGERWVGVAPFAAHEQKIYPLDKMHQVVDMLAASGCKVFLFGAGDKERDVLGRWESEYAAKAESGSGKVISTCGLLGGLRNEMLLMSCLDLMLSMDSANMHIASIFGTRVLSIWGATHPKAGFSGFGQTPDSEMQLNLPCRPCSIYGKTPCQFGDMRCMAIEPSAVVAKAMEMIADA